MPYVTPEQIERAKQIDLLTYLQTYEPQELVRFSGNVYTTRTHDSLKISNGKWCWRGMTLPKYATLRGTFGKHFSFFIPARQESRRLYLFESAIDLLSYGTLELLSGRDWRQENCLSLAGIYMPKKIIIVLKIRQPQERELL